MKRWIVTIDNGITKREKVFSNQEKMCDYLDSMTLFNAERIMNKEPQIKVTYREVEL